MAAVSRPEYGNLFDRVRFWDFSCGPVYSKSSSSFQKSVSVPGNASQST
jgi:hypothetical protein